MQRHATLIAASAILVLLGGCQQRSSAGPDGPWRSRALALVDLAFRPELPPLTIAIDGKAACDIVIPGGGPDAAYYRTVADRLKRLLDQATGADIPVLTERTVRQGIFIGPSAEPFTHAVYARCAAMPLESLCVESFAGGIVLAGRDGASPVAGTAEAPGADAIHRSRGTFFATADFLERMLGFRFYFPGRLGTQIPSLGSGTLNIPAVAYSDHPVFALRKSSYPGYETLDGKLLGADGTARREWERWQRSGDVLYENFGHTDVAWHPAYAQEHPEFFALRDDGTRAIGDRGKQSSHRCLADPDGFRVHLDLIARALAGENVTALFNSRDCLPNGRYIYWWPNDGFSGCRCPDCRRLTDPDAPYYGVYARLVWDYILRLSQAVAERWPDKVLRVPLYQNYGVIPAGVKVPDNVALNVVRFGTGRFPAAYFKEPAYLQNAIDDIAEIARRSHQKPWIWVHYPHSPRIKDSVMIPYPVPHLMQRFMAANRDVISGLYLNGHSTASYAYDGLVSYLWFRLLWNPDLDIDALIEEFSQLWGPAAADIGGFHRLIIERWEGTRWPDVPAPKDFEFNMPRDAVWELTYPTAVRTRLAGLLDSAAARCAPGNIFADRVAYLRAAYAPFFDQGLRHDQHTVIRMDCPVMTPEIDGDLREWPEPQTLRDNVSGRKADQRTVFHACHDGEALYFAATAWQDAPFATPASSPVRDAEIWKNDSLEFFICTEREGLREAGMATTAQYHHIIVDTAGRIYDAYKGVGGREDATADLGVTARTRTTPDRFDVELRIPFARLGCRPPTPGVAWPCNVYRNRVGTGPGMRAYAWSPTVGGFAQPERFGILAFPAPALWSKDFTDPADAFTIERQPPNAVVSMHNTDGRCRIRVRTPPGSPPGEVKLALSGIPARNAAGHVTVEWSYTTEGTGIRSIRSYAAAAGDRRLAPYLRHFGQGENAEDATTIRCEGTADGGQLTTISYFAVGITLGPGADAILAVDQVRAFDLGER